MDVLPESLLNPGKRKFNFSQAACCRFRQEPPVSHNSTKLCPEIHAIAGAGGGGVGGGGGTGAGKRRWIRPSLPEHRGTTNNVTIRYNSRQITLTVLCALQFYQSFDFDGEEVIDVVLCPFKL